MAQCPVEDCKEVNQIRSSLRRGMGIGISFIILISGAAVVTWAKADRVPKIEEKVETIESSDSKQNTEIAVLKARQEIILKNTEKMLAMMEAEKRRKKRDED